MWRWGCGSGDENVGVGMRIWGGECGGGDVEVGM